MSSEVILVVTVLGGVQALIAIGDRLWKRKENNRCSLVVHELLQAQSIHAKNHHEAVMSSIEENRTALNQLAEALTKLTIHLENTGKGVTANGEALVRMSQAMTQLASLQESNQRFEQQWHQDFLSLLRAKGTN